MTFLRAGVGAGGEEQKASAISVYQLPWLAIIVATLFVGTLSCATSNCVVYVF